MRWTRPLTTAALVILLGAAGALAAQTPEFHVEPVATARDYAGSAACLECHRDIHNQWSASGHARAITEPSPDTVLGDFSGVTFESFGMQYRAYKDGDRYMMDMPTRTGERVQLPVYRVLGYRQVQMYLTQYEGRLQMMPLGWGVRDGEWANSMEDLNNFKHVDEAHQNFWANQGRTWDLNCHVCHRGVPDRMLDATGKPTLTGIKFASVGCESCHGPGKQHIALWKNLKPERTGLRDTSIVNTRHLDRNVGVSMCISCHTEYVRYFNDFNPGDDFFQSFRLLTFEDNDIFWPDGRPRRHSTRMQGLMVSKCFWNSNMQCTTCHQSHGDNLGPQYKATLNSDRMCLQCHEEEGVRISAHTRHKPDSEGSRCVNCHMPKLGINYPNAAPMRLHTITIPLPELTRDYGTPNACLVCHEDREPEWAVRWRNRWWGPSEHPRLRWAEAITKGRADDPSGIPLLVSLLEDKNENPLMRASAAKMLGLMRALDAGPALTDALTDPDPTVRINAVLAFQRWNLRRTAPALTKALHDKNRIVRAEAAYTLGRMRAAPARGPDGDAYEAASREYEAYLAVHPEWADMRIKAGNYYFDRFEFDLARAAYQEAIDIDHRPGAKCLEQPGVPYENIGSLLWTRHQYPEALDYFTKAVDVQPDLYSARKKLANGLRSANQVEPAIAQYEALLGIAPKDVASRLQLGELYLRAGRYEDALEAADRVLEEYPDNVSAQVLKQQAEQRG